MIVSETSHLFMYCNIAWKDKAVIHNASNRYLTSTKHEHRNPSFSCEFLEIETCWTTFQVLRLQTRPIIFS